MKKLNKLLMPIVGLSTIAATAIPLASCKNGYTDGVEVTKKEYQEAFEYLAACKEGSSWKTSTEDTIQSISVNNGTGELVNWAEYYDIAFNDDYGTAKAIGSSRSSAYETELLTSIRKNNCYFSIFEDADAEEKTHKSVSVDTTSEIQGFLVEIASYYYDYYDDGLVFDKDTKTYMYNGAKKEGDTVMYAQSKVRFDSNKKITYINTHFGLIESGETTLMDIVLHPKYDNVKVDVDQEYKDLVETHTKEMTNNSLEVAKSGIMIKGISDKAPLLVNITPKSGNETKLTVACDDAAAWTSSATVNGIYKNGELLEEDSTGAKGYKVEGKTITFKDALKTSDKINVAYSLNGISASTITKFTFTLA